MSFSYSGNRSHEYLDNPLNLAMKYLPLFIDISNTDCLVVGGGKIATRKVTLLLEAGGTVTVLAPQLNDALNQLLDKKKINYQRKTFTPEDVVGYRLIISATNNEQVNKQVSYAAHNQGILVNVVDAPKLSSFIFPSIVDRTPVIAAVSTGGASPVLARLLRGRLESLIPASYGRLARLAEQFREQVKTKIKDSRLRRKFWEDNLQGWVAELVYAGQESQAAEELNRNIGLSQTSRPSPGQVYLVGAGPGEPDLLTFRALRLMQSADVVVYDRLVSPEIRKLVRRDAELIYAGKERNKHSIPQAKINDLLARLAKNGKRVVRLKGGDPFIFGRGGEEIETLMDQGIPCQVVPGITAASGCASYAGIPLTHRDYAQSCTFVAGHLKDGTINLNWDQLVAPNQTLVIYMGLLGLRQLCQKLIEHGAASDLPIALIERGTTRYQRVLTGTLETLPDIVNMQDITPPTLIVVGNVVRLHKRLSWYNPCN